jgi:hypothetical protein
VEQVALRHRHQTKKTHICFVEYDDVNFARLADARYFGEGNSKGRKLDYNFEYCLTCEMRRLNGKPIMTRDILEDELERYATQAKAGNHIATAERTVQHSDFEPLQRLIEAALRFGKLQKHQKNSSS